MANEGSTKPTYSELENAIASWKAEELLWREREHELLTKLQSYDAGAENLIAELARVRGLLQRGVELVQPQACSDSFCGDTGHVKVKKWLSEAGAESADIGKLDGADKCDCVGGCGRDTNLGIPVGKCQRVIAEDEAIAKSGVEMGKVNRVPPNVYELLRWFVERSNHEGFCGQCPPVNKGTTCKCDWPGMKAKAERVLGDPRKEGRTHSKFGDIKKAVRTLRRMLGNECKSLRLNRQQLLALCEEIDPIEFEKPAEGEWVQPVRKGYKLACCDCALSHLMEFRIHRGRVQFRAWRDNRATANKRRGYSGIRFNGTEPATSKRTASENTKNDSAASPELLPTQIDTKEKS